MIKWLTEEQVYVRLEVALREAGSARALARKWHISDQFLCDVRQRRRNLTNTIFDALDVEKVTTYRVNRP